MILVVAMVVVERTGGGRRPVALENPFRDMGLPESSSGSADGRDHEVPTEATQSVEAPAPAAVDKAVPDLPGAVPTTVDKPLTFEKPAARNERGAAPTSVTAKIGPIDEAVVKDPPAPDAGQTAAPKAGRVEVAERRTETTSVFRNPDGTYTSEMSLGPTNFRDGTGSWRKIDTTLVPGDRGRLRVAATEVSTDLAPTASDPQLGRLEIEEGVSAAFGIAEAAPSTASIDDAVATYADVRESADLQVGSTPNGLKDIITLKSVDAPTTWTFPLTLEGLTAKVVDGQVQLTDSDGELRGLVPAGWMKDSGTTGVDDLAGGEGPPRLCGECPRGVRGAEGPGRLYFFACLIDEADRAGGGSCSRAPAFGTNQVPSALGGSAAEVMGEVGRDVGHAGGFCEFVETFG